MRCRILIPPVMLVFSCSVHSAAIADLLTLGGVDLQDSLANVSVLPDPDFAGFESFVTGFPEEPTNQTWVNHDNTTMTASFGGTYLDGTGNDLVLETSFHADNYSEVVLLLDGGGESSGVPVLAADWTLLGDIIWNYRTAGGVTSSTSGKHLMIEFDFVSDFGLSPTDVVSGIRIGFGTTASQTDFAGGYITENATAVPAPSSGDFDGDGDVDGFDFLMWQRGMSPNPFSQSDLALWESQYGGPPPLSAVATVPESFTCTLALAALCLAMSRRQIAAR